MSNLSPTCVRAWVCRSIWLLIACCTSLLAAAQTPAILRKADSLAAAGDAPGALHELRRHAFYGGVLDEPHQCLQARCLFASGQWRESITAWTSIARRSSDSTQRDSAWFCAAVAAHLLGEQVECISLLERFSPAQRDDENRLNATVLKAIAYNSQGRFEEGRACMMALAAGDDRLISTIDSAYRRPLRFRAHSQDLALVLSVVLPGSGQAYAGKPLDGLLSLMLTGGTGALGVYSFVQGHYFFTFITCLTLFQKFYEGGARHAVRLARQRTEDRKTERIKAVNSFLLQALQE